MNQIEKYFNAEKYESILFVLVGITAISFALHFLIKIKQPFFNGVSYPLISVALVQIIVGSSVYFRSPKDITRVNQIIQIEKRKIATDEIPRMEVVMKNFLIYRWVEIALLLVGVCMYLFIDSSTFLKGVGLGLMIQASFMLLLYYFAESRGKIYVAFLKAMV